MVEATGLRSIISILTQRGMCHAASSSRGLNLNAKLVNVQFRHEDVGSLSKNGYLATYVTKAIALSTPPIVHFLDFDQLYGFS